MKIATIFLKYVLTEALDFILPGKQYVNGWVNFN